MDRSVLRSGRTTVDLPPSDSRLYFASLENSDRQGRSLETFRLLLQPGMEALLDTCGRRRVTCLLLLHLFVVKAAADCPKPERQGNIVLTNEALLRNDFPDGVYVTFECANGYVIESGSGKMTCLHNTWTGPDIICKKKDCGTPKPQSNMSFNTSGGTLFGDVLNLVCDKGFLVIGSSFKQCFASGWFGNARCKIVTCDKPGEVTNGRSSWDSQDGPKYGETIYYICSEGYTLVGKNSVMCSETGVYDSPPPSCEGVTTEMATPPTSTPPAQGVTTEMATPPTSTSPAQEVSTSTNASATPTAHRDKTVTSNATPTVSPSVRGGSDISTAQGKATTTTEMPMASSSLPGKQFGTVDTNKDIGYTPVIVSVICISLVVCICAVFLHKFLLRRKGSYDTREDLKPELLQFQNL